MTQLQWSVISVESPPDWFVEAVKSYVPNSAGHYAAQLLWQRGVQDMQQLAEFIKPQLYQASSPFVFGQEMEQAVARLQMARDRTEKVTIWGDFDADGITSTAVLWDGLGQFFPQHQQLSYYIPNRLTQSHGLNCQGIDELAQNNTALIVTCDTGSTNIEEITYANSLGIDVIVTDHHTLPSDRPPVTAIINPRYLPSNHQLFNLSGVAVAYKLVEALYQTLPDVPQQPLEDLLDLVAIGLIADLVQLNGDCRYLAQVGIEKMQLDSKKLETERRRPGVGRLLDLCRRSGDRPTDISFGLGPRINAVSRIQGDASFCVELLTSRDVERCNQLAQETELANARRKSLQKDVQQQVNAKLEQMDLSTTSVIVLEDPQWAVGVLGLVAGQVAQQTGRPTVLLSTEGQTAFARGSARSVNQVDLYQLVKDQAHLLHRFGGHPFAAGLSLPIENIPLFTDAINQRLRQILGNATSPPTMQADLVVTVADLGEQLFRELKLLEPCGMGNPVPKLLIQNCWFEKVKNQNICDFKGKKVKYIKTEFQLRDESTNLRFPGVWWGHYSEEIPQGRCDAIVELDHNSYKNPEKNIKPHYEVRLIAIRSSAIANQCTSLALPNKILDWRQEGSLQVASVLVVKNCPSNWDDLRAWYERSLDENKPLAIAFSAPNPVTPRQVWLNLVGIAKYLSRTEQSVTRIQLMEKLGISDLLLRLGFTALKCLGFKVSFQNGAFKMSLLQVESTITDTENLQTIEQFIAAVREEQFQRQYFYKVPLSTISAVFSEELPVEV
jgi:single-stranded-DNA-specific exonuclease